MQEVKGKYTHSDQRKFTYHVIFKAEELAIKTQASAFPENLKEIIYSFNKEILPFSEGIREGDVQDVNILWQISVDHEKGIVRFKSMVPDKIERNLSLGKLGQEYNMQYSILAQAINELKTQSLALSDLWQSRLDKLAKRIGYQISGRGERTV